MKMKIGLINFNCSNNYGAVLQCVALQKYLESCGHDVIVLDYCPTYLIQQQIPFPNPFFFFSWAWFEYKKAPLLKRIIKSLIRFLNSLLKWRYFYIKIKRNKEFNSFRKKELNLSKNRYVLYKELLSNHDKCDAYIAGSDQIWNPHVTHSRLDGSFFLAFAEKESIKIAYAASPCQLKIADYRDDLINLFNGLDFISIREKEKMQDLQGLTDKKICLVKDPTFLLGKTDYLSLEQSLVIPEKFVLVYGFLDGTNPKLLGNVANYISKLFSLPIIDVSFDCLNIPCKRKWLKTINPGNFLYLINKATIVVTNSFHCNAFSLIYQKNVIVTEKKITGSRMRDLMESVGLSNRLFDSYDEQALNKAIFSNIDYQKISKIINRDVLSSVDFLSNSLKGNIFNND